MTRERPATDGPYRSDGSTPALRRALEAGEIPVAVYGLGKMGLPLATVYARETGRVVGVDTDPSVVAAVDDGACHVTGEPGLPAAVATAVDEGRLCATTDGEAAARDAALHVVIVPTLVDDDGAPDLAVLESVTGTIASGLEPGDQVVVESTVPPGTCRSVVGPRLAGESAVPADAFGLAFCPERTKSGRALADIRAGYPKVVGGIDAESTRVARAVYETVTDTDVVPVTDCTTAECVKVFEGVYRDVNIALANELATLADELAVDVLAAIDVANTLPYCDIHAPGAGVGGHCIPVYPHFLIGGCATPTPLLETAREVNDGMSELVVDRLETALADRETSLSEATVAILGVTYRPGIDEIRKSPAVPIAATLRAAGATVFAVDPVCSSMDAIAARPVEVDDLAALELDAAVVATAHEEFRDVDWEALESMVVVDGRQALEDPSNHLVYTIGRGYSSRPETARSGR